jgi:hypothetical protein
MTLIPNLPSNRGVLPNEYYAMAAMQMMAGQSYDDRVGHSSVISTTRMLLSNVTSAARPFNFPASPMQMQVVSTSASDTGVGIGTQEVEIDYMTSPTSIQPFKRKTEFITMNGVAPVNTVATDIYRVDRFRSSRTGTNMQSVGDISLQSVGGATLYELIEASYNMSRSAIHWVEKGYMSIVTDIAFSVNTDAGIRVTLSHTDEPNGYAVRHAALALEIGNVAVQNSYNTPTVTANPYGKEHYVCLLVSGKASNQVAAGTIKFIDLPL